MGNRWNQKFRGLFAVAFLLLFLGCGGNENKASVQTAPEGVSISVKVVIPPASERESVKSMSSSLGNEQDDVTSVTILATWAGGSNGPVNCNQTGPGSEWQGSLNNLPSNVQITLTVSAKDINGTEIYTGTSILSLIPGQSVSVTVNMAAVDAGPVHIPTVTSVVWSAASIHVNHSATLDVTVADDDGDAVTYTLTPTFPDSFFDVFTDLVNPANGVPDTFNRIYTAGDTDGTDTITIDLDDGTGLTSSFTTSIMVDTLGDIDSTINFPPDITAIDAEENGAQTIFTATVSDDQSPAGLTYEWSINGVPAGSTNPIVVNTPSANATITVTVTDALGASRTYSLIWSGGVITFKRTYGGASNEDYPHGQQTTDGGYILVSTQAASHAYLVKTDQEGNEVWSKTISDFNGGVGCVMQTLDGGYMIGGSTLSYGSGGYWRSHVVKTDTAGNKIWHQVFNGTNGGFASIKHTSDGGYILIGTENSGYGSDTCNVHLVRLDSSGGVLWTRILGGSYNDFGYSVQQTSDGGFILLGSTRSFGAGGYDLYLIKTDSAGNQLWDKTFGGANDDNGFSLQITPDGGYVLSGYTGSFGAGMQDIYMIKTDSAGNQLWDKTFGGANYENGWSVKLTSDGGYIILGYTGSFGAGMQDIYMIKTDAGGNMLWDKTYGGANDESGFEIHQTTDGGYALFGFTMSYGAGGEDMYLIKTDANGEVAP